MTTGQGTEARPASPVTIEGRLDADLSRWLWVVKWLLAIPHYVVLAFLWLAFFVLTVVAFFAILFTGRYPRGIFDFNVGVLRWSWRVAFYSYGALGTDRYPPFTLDEAPDYPATLDVEYPERLSRGLVLVKWWLLAIPQYLLVAIMVGGGSFAASRADDWQWGGFAGGLVGLLVLIRRPRARLHGTLSRAASSTSCSGSTAGSRASSAYAGLMTDRYPPFRLDQGGTEPGAAGGGRRRDPARGRGHRACAAERGRGGRIVLLVLGSIAALFAFATLAGGCALVAIDQTQRDDDGFLMSPSEDLSTSTYAIVSESAELDTSGAEWALDTFLGTVRIRSESERPVFVGIARQVEVAAYLGGVERDRVSNFDFEGDPRYEREPGAAPDGPPGDQTFWVASASGAGEQTLEWEPEDGDWQVVLMNADASRGVSSDVSIGAELDSVLWVGLALLGVGALLAALAALAVTAGIRRGRRPRQEERQGST